ncbi:MAG: hypothetical protein II504_11065 [Clostridia bacterium]|nr:hypothetical protein [Clostridia bacterium]
MMDIREATCIIIRKNREFLQGTEWITHRPMWTPYKWNAWRTRDKAEAAEVARKTGGVMVLFNPIARQMKVIGA